MQDCHKNQITHTTLTSIAQVVGHHPTKQKVKIWFRIRAHAWIVGSVPAKDRSSRGSLLMFLSHITVHLPLFSSFPLSLEINK